MLFPSLPIYSSDPLNWPQQNIISDGGVGYDDHHHFQHPPPSAGGGGSIKPVHMDDRARAEKIPHPEAALKCPRCESTNTKFCYFNNYSLTQPRHFCKTCRRYWTRGGALRNVPVGGGCRRNKRSGGKGSRSKSPAAGDRSSTSSVLPPAATTSSDVMMPHFPDFLTHLSHNYQYGGSGAGLSFDGIPVGGVRGNGNNSNLNSDVAFQMNTSNGFSEQWRVQQGQGHGQFPFFTGMETTPATGNMYTVEQEPTEPPQNRSKALDTETAAVKMEGFNLSRDSLGISGDHNQYWRGGAWTELGGFANSSSSTSHIL